MSISLSNVAQQIVLLDHRLYGTDAYYGTIATLHGKFPKVALFATLYERAITGFVENFKAYDQYLKETVCKGFSLPPEVCSNWRGVMTIAFNYFDQDPRLTPFRLLKSVLNLEGAGYGEYEGFMTAYVRQYLMRDGEQDLAVLEKTKAFIQDVFLRPFIPGISLDDIIGALRYVVLDLAKGTEEELWSLIRDVNEWSNGRLLRMSTGRLDPEFQMLRRNAFEETYIQMGGITYENIKVLGQPDAEGRDCLTLLVKNPEGQLKVLRFGPHIAAAGYFLAPEWWIRYAEERAQAKTNLSREAEPTTSGPGSFDWFFPPLPPEKINGGVVVQPFLHVLTFSSGLWQTSNPLTPSQEEFLDIVGKAFVGLRDEKKRLPRTLEEIKKIGIEMSGSHSLLQTSPLQTAPFTYAWAEELMRQMVVENFNLFKRLRTPLFVDSGVAFCDWPLMADVKELAKTLWETGDLPPMVPDISDALIEQRNKVIEVRKKLTAKRFGKEEIGRVIGFWMQKTGVVQISKWERLEADVGQLLLAEIAKKKVGEYALPDDLNAMYMEMKMALESRRSRGK